MKRLLLAALSGALFGAGLVVSGMSNPDKVLNFLDVLGPWDPSLLLVMAAATGVSLVGYRLVMRRAAPLCDDAFHLPAKLRIDGFLVFGAVLFGVGWGLAGYCPGPSLTALVIAPREGALFVAALLLGVLSWRGWSRRRNLLAGD